MTADAAGFPAEKFQSAFCFFRQRIRVTGKIPVEWRIVTDERSFEVSEQCGNCITVDSTAKNLSEPLGVAGDGL